MSLIEGTVRSLLEAISGPDPTPGGGSASALAAALGTSLLAMVAAMPKSRSNSDEEKVILRKASTQLAPLRTRLIELVDEDSRAYDAVVAAYRLPKTTDDDKAARKAAVQDAMLEASEVPLAVMRSAAEALAQAEAVARCGNRNASSDVGVAIELLQAGLRGAGMNVRINLESLSDRIAADRMAAEAWRLEASAATLAKHAQEELKA